MRQYGELATPLVQLRSWSARTQPPLQVAHTVEPHLCQQPGQQQHTLLVVVRLQAIVIMVVLLGQSPSTRQHDRSHQCDRPHSRANHRLSARPSHVQDHSRSSACVPINHGHNHRNQYPLQDKSRQSSHHGSPNRRNRHRRITEYRHRHDNRERISSTSSNLCTE